MERTLLLVDDEENILRALQRTLRRDGYTILHATSGAEGLEILAQHPVGVIISDQRMPGMTGVEFLNQVKALYPKTVRIALSGYTDLESITDAINRGAIYKFLTKPWEDDLLRQNISEAFAKFEMAEENARLSREIAAVNAELEQRVEQKTHELVVHNQALRIAREVLEHLPVAVLGLDEDGTVVVANDAAEAALGAAQGLIGTALSDWLPGEVAAQVTRGAHGPQGHIALPAGRWQLHSAPIGEAGSGRGTVVALLPESGGGQGA